MVNDFLEKLSFFFIKLATFCVKLALFCIVIYLIGMRLFHFGHRLFYERALDEEGKQVVFEIKEGDTVEVIADNLEEAGLIDDKLVFRFRAKIYETNFTPNIYNLDTSMTIKNMLDIFDSPTSDYVVNTSETGDVYQLPSEEDNLRDDATSAVNSVE